jgi:arginine/glutamate-rich protein 1
LKRKDEEICRFKNHNKKILDEVNRLKEENKHCQNKEKERTLDEETTKRLEEEIYKKVEESLNTDEVKLELKSKTEEGHQNLINGVTLQLQKDK